MGEGKSEIGRLALRREGNFWNAYYALPGTMEGAVLIGSIGMCFVEENEERKTAFMDVMREAVGDIIEQKIGVRPTWPEGPQSAPENEKAGHG